MITVNVIDTNGNKESIRVEENTTLMEALRFNGSKQYVSADCGGSCACANCHIYLNKEWFDKIDKLEYNSSEQVMVEYNPNFEDGRSRLSCQIVLKKEYDGIEVILSDE